MLLQRLRLRTSPLDLRGFVRRLSPAAIILGSALNILEAGKFTRCITILGRAKSEFKAVSIGLLIFPPVEGQDAFSGLQTQAMSLYIMRLVT